VNTIVKIEKIAINMNPCADVFNIEKIIGKTNPPKLPIAATIPDVIPISFGK